MKHLRYLAVACLVTPHASQSFGGLDEPQMIGVGICCAVVAAVCGIKYVSSTSKKDSDKDKRETAASALPRPHAVACNASTLGAPQPSQQGSCQDQVNTPHCSTCLPGLEWKDAIQELSGVVQGVAVAGVVIATGRAIPLRPGRVRAVVEMVMTHMVSTAASHIGIRARTPLQALTAQAIVMASSWRQ